MIQYSDSLKIKAFKKQKIKTKHMKSLSFQKLKLWALSHTKTVSGIIFLLFFMFGMAFIMDPSSFSASLVSSKIYESENVEEAVNKYAGALPGSPLYSNEFTPGNSDEVIVQFAKLVKSIMRDSESSDVLLVQFMESVQTLPEDKKLQILQTLSEKLIDYDASDELFLLRFQLEFEQNKDISFIKNLGESILQTPNTLQKQLLGKAVFESFIQKSDWQKVLKEAHVYLALKNIKQAVLQPFEKNGETVHISPSKWMLQNPVFRLIK
ncbi:hypothetical protein COB57_01660 [Candidatus Peregrinibacteria bacterium]|nr:MAG: hypothetical protein COB57_01660 [Candidatus Peregrinibacteria bacterium]